MPTGDPTQTVHEYPTVTTGYVSDSHNWPVSSNLSYAYTESPTDRHKREVILALLQHDSVVGPIFDSARSAAQRDKSIESVIETVRRLTSI